MRIILIGPPGSGKGTQAHWINQRYNIPHLAMGDMLRHIATESSLLGQETAALLKQGQLVPDAMAIDLIKRSTIQLGYRSGFILDGFPRTLIQATMLSKALTIDLVIIFSVPDAVIISRLKNRRIHPASGRIYHLYHNPPKVFNQDDITQEALVQRSDDTEPAIKQRLAIYHEQTQPVIDYYRELSCEQTTPKYHTIACDASIEAIRHQIEKLITHYL